MTAVRRLIHALKRTGRAIPAPVRRLAFRGRRRLCPLCGSHLRRFLAFGLEPRPEALCPVCESLERHRLLWLYFRERTDLFDGRPRRFLHFAPAPALARHLERVDGLDYLTADLNAPRVMTKMDVTAIAAPDDTFDVVCCNHVLEHVPDDRRAMSEILRVLRPGGWAILQVPIRGETTQEDLSITDPRERERRYGQYDHVRQYGRDYAARLREAGFDVSVDAFVRTLDPDRVRYHGLPAEEDIYVCRKPERQAVTHENRAERDDAG